MLADIGIDREQIPAMIAQGLIAPSGAVPQAHDSRRGRVRRQYRGDASNDVSPPSVAA